MFVEGCLDGLGSESSGNSLLVTHLWKNRLLNKQIMKAPFMTSKSLMSRLATERRKGNSNDDI